MVSKKRILADSLFSLVILAAAFLVNLLLVQRFGTKSMTPMIFVLGVFLISWRTQGYLYGILSSLVSVLAKLGAGNPFLMYTIIVWASVLISAYILIWLLFGA